MFSTYTFSLATEIDRAKVLARNTNCRFANSVLCIGGIVHRISISISMVYSITWELLANIIFLLDPACSDCKCSQWICLNLPREPNSFILACKPGVGGSYIQLAVLIIVVLLVRVGFKAEKLVGNRETNVGVPVIYDAISYLVRSLIESRQKVEKISPFD